MVTYLKKVGAMSNSLADSSKCARVKKRVYMPQMADEYNSSSQPLNGEGLEWILVI